jgi:O-antigen/teichoic acid export membrane protein
MASAIILLPFYLGYLSPTTFGALSIYMGISLLVQIFVTFSFDTSVYTYFHDYKNEQPKLHAFLSTAFIFILLLGSFTALILSFGGNWAFHLIFRGSQIQFFPYGFIAVLTGICQAIFKVNSSLLQTQEKASEFLKLNILSFSLTAIFTIIGLMIFPDDLVGPLGGRLAAFAISAGWVIFCVFQRYGNRFDFNLLKSTMGFNQPIWVYQILLWFNTYFDRVLMTLYLPLSQIGVYDLASKCLMGIEFVITGFYNSFYPKVIGTVALQKEKQSTVEINRYYNGVTAVAILLVVLSILVLPVLIQWMAQLFNKPGYLAALQLLPWVAVVYLFRAQRMYVAMPYAAVKYAKPLPFYYAFIILVKIGCMIWFMQLFGLMGVIYSLLIGYSLEVLILFFGVRHKFQFKFNIHKLITAPMTLGLLIIVLEPSYGDYPYLLHLFYLIVGVVLLLWAYRKELKQLDLTKLLK